MLSNFDHLGALKVLNSGGLARTSGTQQQNDLLVFDLLRVGCRNLNQFEELLKTEGPYLLSEHKAHLGQNIGIVDRVLIAHFDKVFEIKLQFSVVDVLSLEQSH